MTLKLLAAAALAAAALTGSAALAQATRPDVAYTVLLFENGKPVASPTVVGQFGEKVRIEVAGLMRVEVEADAPNADAQSLTTASMAVFQNGAWQPAKQMSMPATLTATPSFEYSVDGTPYRFVVMPRRIVAAASQP